MSDMLNKIKSLVQWGRQAKPTDDSGRDQVAQVESTGSAPFAVVYVYPYGMSANAPVECNVVQMNVGGSAKAKVGIPTMMENRFRNREEWESAFGNFKTRAHIYFDDGGNIRLSQSDTEAEDWAVQYTAMNTAYLNLRSDMNALVTQHNTLLANYNTLVGLLVAHTHMAGVVLPPDNAASMIPSTASGASSTSTMTAAKIEKVRLP